MRYPPDMVRRAAPVLVAALVVACAAESSQSKSAAPNGDWQPIGAARSDFQAREHEIDLAGSDCQAACKALASLESAANHLCAVAEPDECTDARVRVDRARRAVTSRCGGC